MWRRAGRTQWACPSCEATTCYVCAPVMYWPSAGAIPAGIVYASEGDLRRMARDYHAADTVVGGGAVATRDCNAADVGAVARQDVLELVCLLTKNPCGSVAPAADVGRVAWMRREAGLA
eukprot:SAG11_NODE_189_length_13028_cov_14.222446_12_plen_119_part_00